MNNDAWPPEWQKGLIELAVLAVIAATPEPTYGYRIVQGLDAAGFGKVKGGTLYPILARLEQAGYLTSSWGEGDGGPGRKFVTMTEPGRIHLKEMAQAWKAYSGMVGVLLKQGVSE